MNQTDSNALLYASLYAMHKWLRQELSYQAPALLEGMYALDYLSRQAMPGEPLDLDRMEFFRKLLVEPEGNRPDISEHFDMVSSTKSMLKAMELI